MRRRRDRGIALILALLVLVILVVVILQMSATSLHNRTLAENHLADLQNTYGVRAGLARAQLFLQADQEQNPEVDSLQEMWASPIEFTFGKALVHVQTFDADRFINLSMLTNDKGEPNPVVVSQLKRLVKNLQFTPDIADRIIDYIDADTKGEFEARAKNDKLFNLEELLRIDGLTPEIIYGGVTPEGERKGLREFLTIWPKTADDGATPGMVNINTAPVEVLWSLSDLMTQGVAEAIVAYRKQPGSDGRLQEFTKVDDLKKVQGMNDGIYASLSGQIAVKSSTFEVRSRSTVGNVEKAWVYVFQRKGAAGPPAAGTPPPPPAPPPPDGSKPPAAAAASLVLIGAQPLNDFTSAKPEEEK